MTIVDSEQTIRDAFGKRFAESQLRKVGQWTNSIYEADDQWIIRLPKTCFNAECFKREWALLNALDQPPICRIPNKPLFDPASLLMAYQKLPGAMAGRDVCECGTPQQRE